MTTIDNLRAFAMPQLLCAECGSVMWVRQSQDGHCTMAKCTALHCKQRGLVGKVQNAVVELIATDESMEFSGRTIENEPTRTFDIKRPLIGIPPGSRECFTCWGAGHLTNRKGEDVTCSVCKGTGYVPLEKESA